MQLNTASTNQAGKGNKRNKTPNDEIDSSDIHNMYKIRKLRLTNIVDLAERDPANAKKALIDIGYPEDKVKYLTPLDLERFISNEIRAHHKKSTLCPPDLDYSSTEKVKEVLIGIGYLEQKINYLSRQGLKLFISSTIEEFVEANDDSLHGLRLKHL